MVIIEEAFIITLAVVVVVVAAAELDGIRAVLLPTPSNDSKRLPAQAGHPEIKPEVAATKLEIKVILFLPLSL